MNIKNWIQRILLSDRDEQIAKLTLRLADVEQELADARALFDPEDYVEKGELDSYVKQDDLSDQLCDYVKDGSGHNALCTELDMQSYVDSSIETALTDFDLSDYLYFTELRDKVNEQEDTIKRLQDIVDGALDLSVLVSSVAEHGNLASMDDINKLRQEMTLFKLSTRRMIQAQVMDELLERVQTILASMQNKGKRKLTEEQYDELCAIVTDYEQL